MSTYFTFIYNSLYLFSTNSLAQFRLRIIFRRVSKSELPCYNGLHVLDLEIPRGRIFLTHRSAVFTLRSEETFFSPAGDQRTNQEVAHFSWTGFAALFVDGKTGREIIFFLELRSPYCVWFMMAWYFEPERQKLRWYFINVIYTSILLHITHDANIVVVVHIFCR